MNELREKEAIRIYGTAELGRPKEVQVDPAEQAELGSYRKRMLKYITHALLRGINESRSDVRPGAPWDSS